MMSWYECLRGGFIVPPLNEVMDTGTQNLESKIQYPDSYKEDDEE